MKVPALLLILLLLSISMSGAGVPFSGFSSPNPEKTCCNSMKPCSMGEKASQPVGHCTCNCNKPANAMAPCSCSHPRMMGPVQSFSERVRQYIIRGYRRITRKNVLEHESRQRLYAMICDHPGLDLKALAELSGLNEHTLKYHLDMMVISGHVSAHRSGGGKHYFENHGTYSATEHALLSRLQEEGSGRILTLVQSNPGLSRGEIAGKLGVSGPVISRSMQTLIDEGLIKQVSDGKYRRYYRAQINV
ncbi:MAG: winged helix-turn-helix transcriptional regulator [Methanospirillum sp.]|nr:winged helix-turn-helix transcriptional regulator [Methanospirillum sp.]